MLRAAQRRAESQESLQPEDDVSEWRQEPGGVGRGWGGSSVRQSCGEYKTKT